jgi:hypothetical protein
MADVPADWVEIATGLSLSSSVVLNTDGQGVIEFDPDSGNQRWEVTGVVVSTDQPATATTIPVATNALNCPFAANLNQSNTRGATWSANQDQWSGGTIDVSPADSFCVVFTPPPGLSGTAIAPLVGVTAYATVTGTKYTRRS